MESRQYVEDFLYVQYNMRNLYRQLFALQTPNDGWKRCLCLFSLHELEEWLEEVEPWREKERRCLEVEQEEVRKYAEQYRHAPLPVPYNADARKLQASMEEGADPLPPPYEQGMFTLLSLEMKFDHYCPMEWYTDYGGFMPYVLEKKGLETYVHDVETMYSLWVYLHDQYGGVFRQP